MEAYGAFSSVYDVLMADVPYGAWADLVASLIARYGVSKPVREAEENASAPVIKEARAEGDLALRSPCEGGAAGDAELLRQERDLVVDLGCGTGTFTGLLADRGYDVTGVDLSPEMLAVAQEKNVARRTPIPYLCQDMRALDLYCTAGTFVSVCDSVNYLLTDRDVLRAFSRVNKFLFPGGIFIFDFNTIHKYRDVIGTGTIAESGEEAAFIWENRYRGRGCRNEAAITFFAREADGRYRRFDELHVQRGFTLAEIKGFLKAAGMEYVAAYDERTKRKPHAKSERIFVVARERGKL